MNEEAEKRIDAVNKMLFHSPPKSKPNPTNNTRHRVLTLSGQKRPRPSSLGKNLAIGESGSSSSSSAEASLCRPWDRDDLFRRLSTFKSITWFAKPQVVSPLECARKGWVNVDLDTIACASCNARLLFSTPSAWTLKQVEKAAKVFSLKLESGHKLLCHWNNNVCTESLAQFPTVSRTELIENYKKRFYALSNLIDLPVILPVAIDNVRSPQLEQFLSESSTSEYQEPLGISREMLPGHVPETTSSSSLYSQALKLISLFGWEPHSLPYTVEFKDGQNQSIRDANVTVTAGQKPKVNSHSLCTGEGTTTSSELKLDPSSVVLDCNLCGARVGLWAFCTTSQPLEYVRFVGVTEITGKNVTTHDDFAQEGFSGYQTPTGDKESIENTVSTATTSSGFTIAGGPPPGKLNYGATISLPVIGPNLRARLSIEKEAKDHLAIQKLSQVEGQQVSLESENALSEAPSATTGQELIAINPLEVPQSVAGGSISNVVVTRAVIPFNSVADPHSSEAEGFPCSTLLDNTTSRTVVGGSELNKEEMVEAENCEKGSSYPGVAPFTKDKPVSFSTRENTKLPCFDKSREFDPIQQHRHFCPWIISTGKFAPGWKQTLCALVGQRETDNAPLSALIEVDDPVVSVRNLFTTPN